jgi:hypothetical protein
MHSKTLKRGITATLVANLAVIAYVASQAYPSSEAVRLRNSLLIAPAHASVGMWTPENMPTTFLLEKMPPPALMTQAVQRLVPDPSVPNLEEARAIAGHLLTHVKDSGPIQDSDVEATYKEIIEEGRGYCSDIVDAFTALALAGGIPVRSWAFSFDGFGGLGHVVVEVFSAELQRWVMLDVFNNVMPVTGSTDEPMSVREFVQRFRENEAEIRFVRIAAGRVAYSLDEKLRAYYRRGTDQWYFWEGNNVLSRGRANALITLAGQTSQAAAELAAIATGHYPRIVPLPTRTNAVHIERMFTLRKRLLTSMVVSCLLVVLLVVQVFAYLKGRRTE